MLFCQSRPLKNSHQNFEIDIKAREDLKIYFLRLLGRSCMAIHEYQSARLKFEDQECTVTGLTPFKDAQLLKPLRAPSLHDSTCAHVLACEELELPREYRLHSRILKHTTISQKMRARLRVFLMNESAKQWMFRDTCALACTYADLYFLNGGTVDTAQLQTLIIACLMIAAKNREGNFPIISEKTFNRDELLQFEKRVIITLAFRLNPPTHYTYAQRAVFLWDHFTEEQHTYNFKFSEQIVGVNTKLRNFYEQLDCVFMALKTLDMDLEEVVMNLFYLHARMLNVYQIDTSSLTDEEFCNFFYPLHDNFLNFFEKFLSRYYKHSVCINESMGCYLRSFLQVTAGKKGWQLQDQRQHYQKIRIWDEVQTLPNQCYATIKNILSKIKKGS